eukprot:7377046-Prymnesium_polylepis.1
MSRVVLLLSRFANVESVRDGVTALHESVRLGRVDLAKLLIDAKAVVNQPTARKDRLTSLHLASASGDLAIVRLLLESGADACALSADGRVPANVAKKLSKVRQPLLMAQRKAEAARAAALRTSIKEGRVASTWVDTLSALKAAQLIAAAEKGDAMQVQALITKRADPDSRSRGISALQAAVSHRNVEVVSLLLRAGASANVTAKGSSTSKNGSAVEPVLAPLHLAARRGPVDIVRLLVDASADAMAAT